MLLTPKISDKTFTSLEGFIGRDPVRSEIVLAIRGSESIRNWIADLTLSKTSVSFIFPQPRFMSSFTDKIALHETVLSAAVVLYLFVSLPLPRAAPKF